MSTLQLTTRIAIGLGAAVLAACAKKDAAATDSAAAISSSTPTTTAKPAAPISLADVAGKWNMRSVPTTGDTTPTTYVMTATGNTSGWTLTFPTRKPLPARITVDGDSIMIAAGPYESVRRKGVQVTTDGILRLQGGNLTGHNTAHYSVKTADSVLTLDTKGTRAQ